MKTGAVIAVVGATVLLAMCYVMVNSGARNEPFRPPEVKLQPVVQTKIVTSTGCPGGDGHIPSDEALDKLTPQQLVAIYRNYGSNTEVSCATMLRMGKMDDGGWEVCDDAYVRPRNNCLVYSFGINNDFSFDDHIGKYYGCEVHAFDPSMNMPDTKRSEHVMFHHLGVSGSNGFIKKTWPVKTIKEIKKVLGHVNRPLDVLKMDIEGSEWPTLDTALKDGSLKNVTQFLFETHNFDDSRQSSLTKLKLLRRIREHGFRTFYAHKNFHCPVGAKTEIPLRTACHEIHTIYIPACDITKKV